MQKQREKLHARFDEIKGELDPQRLEQEMVMLLQKQDISEELDRLKTHVLEARRILKNEAPVGRRLDFLMQELHRETNTLGVKVIDSKTSAQVVDLKVLIEQMREQVQNIE